MAQESGPWEDYRRPLIEDGPWADYAPKAAPERTNADWSLGEELKTPEGREFQQQLKDRALLSQTPGAKNPAYAGVSSAGNTALLNAPRNVLAGVRSLRSGRPFVEEYERLKSIDEASARLNPVASGVGAVAGALGAGAALPVAPAASLLGRMAQGAAIGGGFAGGAELLDTKDVAEAGKAALGGAVLGGAAAPVIEGAARGVAAGLRGAGASIRSLARPEAEAARRLGVALERDAGRGLGEAEIAAAQARGQPVALAERGGEATRALARSAANISPEARDVLTQAASSRFEGQAPRVSEMVLGLGSGESTYAAREALKAAAQRANDPAYRRAFSQTPGAIWDGELAQITQAPVVAEAIKGATRTGANRAAAAGLPAFKNPFRTLESGGVSLRDPNVGPTLPFWDAVKVNLDDRIGALLKSGEKSAARDAIRLKNQLVEKLDATAPLYKDARAGAAAFFGAQDALEAGEKFVTMGGRNEEFRAAIAKMNPHERKLFADGFASRLASRVAESGDRRNVLSMIDNSPAARERIDMALGPDKAAELREFLRVESVMDQLRVALGNSTTARQLAELGLAGSGGWLLTGDPFSGAMLGSAARTAGKWAGRKAQQRVATELARLLTSTDPKALERIAKAAAKSKAVSDAVKSLGARLATLTEPGAADAGGGALGVARGLAPGQLPVAADDERNQPVPAERR